MFKKLSQVVFSKDGKYPDKPHDIFKADKDNEKNV